MKKNFLLFSFNFVIATLVQSQITITNAYFPSQGDTLKTSTDLIILGISMPKNGISQTWDFTSLNAKFITKTFIDVANKGAAFSQFPNADVLENRNGVYYYINKTSKSYEEIGVSGASADFFGINTTTKISPANVLRRAPMSFLDLNSTATNTTATFPIVSLPDSLFGSLSQYLSLVDSLRTKTATTGSQVVDGYGTMNLPIGNFVVLREKRVTYTEADLEVRLKLTKTWLGLKQLIPQGQLPNSLKRFLGKDTTTAYYFFAQNVKEPIAIVTVDNSDNTKVKQITYKNDKLKKVSSSDFSEIKNLLVFPNPTSDVLNITSDENISTIEIFDLVGKNIFIQKADNQKVEIDMSTFQNGVYFLKVNESRLIKCIKL